jgi:large subunit ribosomal protein L23
MAGKNNSNLTLKDSKILIEPLITEASARAAEINKYFFKVSTDARKEEIRRAVEGIFGVKVESVNTVSIPRKAKMRGRVLGFRPGYKKALVSVKEGDKIEFFEAK